ncbi:MAG: cysteine desulfurase [Spirochaetae bacterium HGW-Spirochaetae-3]|nr:MAG: cysteine desulfurase [Spirochaetae bacterium HGW-Spirochaetae-3]
MIYLDNAATSWPKPAEVLSAFRSAMADAGGNPGRAGHRLSLEASRRIEGSRRVLARLLGLPDPTRIVFTLNTTHALNMALKGSLRPGDHVICGSMEHNSVARPLHALERAGIEVTRVRSSPDDGLDPDRVKEALRVSTKAVVTCHASNVSGTVSPVRELGALCRAHGVRFIVDAAQTAGSLEIDMEAMGIDLLAFPGHKGLLGPQGTGGLAVARGIRLETLVEGGTGTASESLDQPEDLPERLESGTPNTPGIAALGAGAAFVLERGIGAIGAAEARHCAILVDSLSAMAGICVTGPSPGRPRASVVSIVMNGADCAELAAILDGSFGIAVRAGLHCAPAAHEELGTLPGGALRISPGAFTTDGDIEACLEAIEAIRRSFQ